MFHIPDPEKFEKELHEGMLNIVRDLAIMILILVLLGLTLSYLFPKTPPPKLPVLEAKPIEPVIPGVELNYVDPNPSSH